MEDKKATKPLNEDDFLLSTLENAHLTLSNEREMANGMVNHFFTLVIASIGGFVYLNTATSTKPVDQQDFELIYVLAVGFVLLILGFSVFIRLIKRHFDGKAYQKGIEKLRRTIKERYLGTDLHSYYESIENLNKELNMSANDIKKELNKSARFQKNKLMAFAWLHRDFLPHLGGAGMVIGLINCILMTVFFGYIFRFVFNLRFWVFDLCAFGIGVLTMLFQIGIYWSKKHVIDSAVKRWEDKSNVSQEFFNARNQTKSFNSGATIAAEVLDNNK